ncbi:LacI family transcriptional regulator [Bacillus shivajii]|uniref:LacI family DNA-binding transcriptional regulator n=1 Tax=Bacillus shivajii TaxID=1983719 RepID=UPI001CF9B69D|nr:LacI family DNA-binding transcriptional regulator [Bacillus shivajii]UCZ52480.1 LacI family transcriptional regulator [Bacillus shivajii]
MTPTIKDVAKRAGVSVSTVSRVMNSPDSVKEEKRKKVQAAIQELNYSPNALARGLIYKKTQTIGALIPDISNSYVSEVILGMENAANRLDLNLMLCNTDRNEERALNYLKALKEKQADGVIITSEALTDAYYDFCKTANLPIVLASTESQMHDIPTVRINDVRAGYDAASYLISKNHRLIGMISGPLDDPIAGYTRHQGFRKRLNEEKLPSDAIEFGDFRFEDGYEAMERFYKKHPQITAVFTASDEMAVGAITYLHERGIKVPEQISVLGFDNTKVGRMFIPKLTTVAQPMYDIGDQAVVKLNTILNGMKLKDTKSYLPHEIIERESVRTLNV